MGRANTKRRYDPQFGELHFPHLRNERFYMKYGVPNVVGCIDCMHVPIAKPDQEQKKHFNKSYHSKKVQIICDSDSNIISVNANPGGSHSHDAILNTHAVKIDLESLNNARDQCWLIGGPHYSQKPYIMTPVPKITKKSPMSPEKYYTTMVSQAHDVVLNTIKQLKSRWKCLQATCNKQFDPATVAQMSVACCVFHNICNKNGIPEAPMTPTTLGWEVYIIYFKEVGMYVIWKEVMYLLHIKLPLWFLLVSDIVIWIEDSPSIQIKKS